MAILSLGLHSLHPPPQASVFIPVILSVTFLKQEKKVAFDKDKQNP